MQNNATTDNPDNQTPELLDREDWELAFKPYEGYPGAALSMGFNLAILRMDLDGLLIKSRPVMEALDLAMEVLFPYTSFHDTSFDLFVRLAEGKLTFEEGQMLNALGIKF